MRIAPDIEMPVGDLTIAVERGLEFRYHRRAERLPGMFLFAHPLHANGAAGQCTGDQSGVCRGIVGTIMSIAARAFDVDAAHLLRPHLQHLRDGIAIGINALRMRPDGQVFALELGDGAGRPNRPMNLIGTCVRCLVRLPDGFRGALVGDGASLRHEPFKRAVELGRLRQ